MFWVVFVVVIVLERYNGTFVFLFSLHAGPTTCTKCWVENWTEIPVWLKTGSIEIEPFFLVWGGSIFFQTVFEIYVRFRKFRLFVLTSCPITPKPVAIDRASIAASDPLFPGRQGVGGGWKMTWKRETQNLARLRVLFAKLFFLPIFAPTPLKRCPIDRAAYEQSRAPQIYVQRHFSRRKTSKLCWKKLRFSKKLIESVKFFLNNFFFNKIHFLTRFSTFGGFFWKKNFPHKSSDINDVGRSALVDPSIASTVLDASWTTIRQ